MDPTHTFSFFRVVQSRNPHYPVGSYVVSNCGWRTHCLSDGSDLRMIHADWPKDLPMSLVLGIVGMPGYNYTDDHDHEYYINIARGLKCFFLNFSVQTDCSLWY